ncbi:glycosyltransferase family 2 protein [Polymorphobacter sp.]|uniref:glycosyltransferase family 2 protein n=1 Tax=Polymorphobacter sp. TaxID=1909290 RepID=UPI003F6FDF68
MKLSVVTAVYNRERTIADAVDSLRRQTHAKVEHIIIDGGSTDGTLDVLRRTLAADARLVSEPDGGIYDAINKGMARATGEVVGLLHSDDWLADNDVLADVARAFTPGIDAVYGDLEYVSDKDPTRIVRHWQAGPYSHARLKQGWMPPHPTLFVRRSFLERHSPGGRPYDTRLRIAADYEAMLRWFSAGMRTAYLPRVLVKMRTGGASNRSLARILRKSREDLTAMRRHGIGGLGTLAAKNLSKIPQFLKK